MNLHKSQQLFQDIINEISFEKKISAGIIDGWSKEKNKKRNSFNYKRFRVCINK